jgi:hypothetical protein
MNDKERALHGPGERERHPGFRLPVTRVFAVLADPAAHAAIDGTGWVQEAADRAPLTAAVTCR